MNNLFLVFGPESAGNHLTARILQLMGCFWEEPQRLDSFLRGSMPIREITTAENIVLRRSIPYGDEAPNALEIKEAFQRENYRTQIIIPFREWAVNALSNYFHRHNSIQEAVTSLQMAYLHIAKNIYKADCPFYLFNVSALYKSFTAIKGLELFTQLQWPEGVVYESIIYDADKGKQQLLKRYQLSLIDKSMVRAAIDRQEVELKRV